MKLGALLKKARESKRLSQHEVAEELSISQKTLSNIESEKTYPPFNQLASMTILYGLDAVDFLSKLGLPLAKEAFQKNNDSDEIKNLFQTLLQEKEIRIKSLENYIQVVWTKRERSNESEKKDFGFF